MARYSVNNYTVDVLLADIKSGNIAIPEMQRPFVWDATQVRDLMDSLYKGFPVGYIIVWQNPSVKLKDGTVAIGKKVLIDGQQRITAMAAAIVGQEVLDSHYKYHFGLCPIQSKHLDSALNRGSNFRGSPIIKLGSILQDILCLARKSIKALQRHNV